MKRVGILSLVVYSVLAGAVVQSRDYKTYRNDQMRLTVRIPDGWRLLEKDKAVGNRSRILLRLRNDAGRLLVVSAEDQTGNAKVYQEAPSDFVPDVTRNLAEVAQLVDYQEGRVELIGGQEFARAKFQVRQKDELLCLFLGVVQGNVLQISVNAGSERELEDEVQVIEDSVKFDPEWSAPATGSPETTQRVRLSRGSADGLITKQVLPTYPKDARHGHVTGVVVLHEIIGADGKVKTLWVVGGDPLLAPGTVRAVRQWEYKPFLFHGTPAEIDTEATVRYSIISR